MKPKSQTQYHNKENYFISYKSIDKTNNWVRAIFSNKEQKIQKKNIWYLEGWLGLNIKTSLAYHSLSSKRKRLFTEKKKF